MIKRYLPFLMIVATVLSSCSAEDNNPIDLDAEGINPLLIKSQKISRDANGKYTIDYTLAKNVQADVIPNATTNVTTLNAFETKHQISNRNLNNSASLNLKNNTIKLNVIENGEQRRSITVEDEAIVLAKGQVSADFLQTYSVENFGDGQYVLDFTVREGVQVDFKYNADKNIYEVHLKEGAIGETSFTKLYNKSEYLPLKIDFVNFTKIKNVQSKGSEAVAIEYAKTPNPRFQWE